MDFHGVIKYPIERHIMVMSTEKIFELKSFSMAFTHMMWPIHRIIGVKDNSV
jgi:hypothetical protein